MIPTTIGMVVLATGAAFLYAAIRGGRVLPILPPGTPARSTGPGET